MAFNSLSLKGWILAMTVILVDLHPHFLKPSCGTANEHNIVELKVNHSSTRFLLYISGAMAQAFNSLSLRGWILAMTVILVDLHPHFLKPSCGTTTKRNIVKLKVENDYP